ncbi:polyphenol oxidase family protein [Bdellovibrio sp. HCB337]|uniref:polyphenol oxidase family protein n=1 Tax=Bdellovibrio sp. HCB337 TaxID=3394358 RepID=UPI0039A4DEA8
MKITETNLGFLIETPKITALLGGEKSQILNLKSSFESLDFIRVKQTHSDIVVHSKDLALDYQVEADSHFTELSKTALCISTADCIPVLLYDPVSEIIAAVHAGWRGVANQIVPKTFARLAHSGVKSENTHVIIGPHIQMASFEVSHQVRDDILSTIDFGTTEKESIYHRNLNHEKALVDLNQVMRTQLQNSGVLFDNLYNLHIDTFVDPRFHSHRRDKEKAGRQLSFICKN